MQAEEIRKCDKVSKKGNYDIDNNLYNRLKNSHIKERKEIILG